MGMSASGERTSARKEIERDRAIIPIIQAPPILSMLGSPFIAIRR